MKIVTRIEIFQEDDAYVALAPDVNVSSFGETPEEAQASIKEALEAFFEECDHMGTLHEVLEESGFINIADGYESRKPVAETALSLAV
jgi:predicted RNase H-like HicB family nuclease